ncbi:PREDICTED: WAP four-disulfide core domain protein 2 isoform X2 [Condylura cristata]|uniref:WAP four-disulfide core domain protein 2 isoform X2 n=1 Tax=Condylura cristata TaxID=143302 RepID=UPI000643348C|nr:PREDICTED: WAP four-disulfide core domain protein 2 isoform X2 [Condylura cristata]
MATSGAEPEKTGVCPEVTVGQNCTQECQSDGECADNLKCCPAGCATICQMPNAGLLPPGGLWDPPARPLRGPVPGGQPVCWPVEMLPQWLWEGVLCHTCLLSLEHCSPRSGEQKFLPGPVSLLRSSGPFLASVPPPGHSSSSSSQ